jgi:hypothetical protein
MIAGAGRADDSPPPDVKSLLHSLNAVVKNGEARGWEQTRLVFVKCGTNEMVFTVPHGLQVDAGTADKITLTAPDRTFYVSLRVRSGGISLADAGSVAARACLLADYSGAKITDEYQAATPEHAGRAYELRWTPTGISERLVRVALIPTEAGTIELTLVADSGKAADGTFAFNSVLTTMRKAQDGKFEFVRTTDAS